MRWSARPLAGRRGNLTADHAAASDAPQRRLQEDSCRQGRSPVSSRPGPLSVRSAGGGAVDQAGRTLDEATIAIRKAHENTDPLFDGANTTLDHVNTQLERVDGITANARAVSGNVSR